MPAICWDNVLSTLWQINTIGSNGLLATAGAFKGL